MGSVILGIDIGTTNIKITAFSTSGEAKYSFTTKNKIFKTGDGYNFDGEYIYSRVLGMLRQVSNKDVKILSIGISSLAETLIPVFTEDINYSRSMVWYDRRTGKQKNEFFREFKDGDFFEITGLKPEYLHSIHKLCWYKENRPEIFKKADKWLPVNSYIAYRLTGEMGIDYTLACRTGALNIKKRKWSGELFSNLPFTEDVFPALLNSGEELGTLSNGIKNELGINYDIPVSLGGHDHICGSYAVAAYRGNVILDSMGTAENIQTMVNISEIDMNNLRDKNVNVGAYVVPGMGYIYDTFDYSGAVIDTLLSLFLNKNREKLTEEDYNILNREAEKFIDEESEIKLYIEQNDRENRYNLRNINILNIKLSTRRGEILLAGIRYIAGKSRKIIRNLEEILNKELDIIIIGGSARNNLLMEEKARVLNKNLYISNVDEAVTLGAALLGGLAGGIYKSYRQAVAEVRRDYRKIIV